MTNKPMGVLFPSNTKEVEQDISELSADQKLVLAYPTAGYSNLFDKTAISQDGYYDATGAWISSAAWNESDFIPCLPKDAIKANNYGAVNYYDAAHARVSGATLGSAPHLTVPDTETIRYFRMAVYDDYIDTLIIVKGTYIYPHKAFEANPPMSYSIISKDNPLTGLRLAVLGDSIPTDTYGRSWARVLAEKYGMILLNYSISGSWVSTTGNHDPACVRYASMHANADIVLVAEGINDYTNAVTIGNSDSTDTAEFYGALNTLIPGLITKYPNAKIGYITPYKTSTSTDATLANYITAILGVCTANNIPALNLFTSRINLKTAGLSGGNYSEGLHLKNNGGEDAASLIEEFVLDMF